MLFHLIPHVIVIFQIVSERYIIKLKVETIKKKTI